MSSPDAGREPLLQATGLTCHRGVARLFSGLSMQASAGEAVCVRGANGSGKTTLLRCLAGLVRPDGGSIRWDGVSIDGHPEAFRADLAYVGHLPSLKDDLTADENLDFALRLRGAAADAARRRAALEAVGLGRRLKLAARRLSAGQRRRISLARLALDPARLWLLDEPLTALDDEGQALFHALLARHLGAGGVCVAATHHELAPGAGSVRVVWLQ